MRTSPERAPAGARVRRVLFVAFAACTLWLVVENSILLVVLPHLFAQTKVEARP